MASVPVGKGILPLLPHQSRITEPFVTAAPVSEHLMSRRLRIEFPGAIYQVTPGGDRREPIFEDDADLEAPLGVIVLAMNRFDAQMQA